MNTSGFKLNIPTLFMPGKHLEGLVVFSLDYESVQLIVKPTLNEVFTFFLSGDPKNNLSTELNLQDFAFWVSDILEFRRGGLEFTVKMKGDFDHSALYASVLFALYQQSNFDGKPDIFSLGNSARDFLVANNSSFDALTFLSYLHGGTRFCIDVNKVPVRQSFPRAYSALLMDRNIDLGIVKNGPTKMEGDSLLSLYHGLFYGDWDYIKNGIKGREKLKFLSSVNNFLDTVESTFTVDVKGNYLFVFPNDLLRFDFIELLVNEKVIEKNDKKVISTVFKDEGISIY